MESAATFSSTPVGDLHTLPVNQEGSCQPVGGGLLRGTAAVSGGAASNWVTAR